MSFSDGERVADSLLEGNCAFDAVFAFTDTLAIGIMNRLRQRGIRVPDEVAIASFSGTELATIVHPPLTTVEPPLHQMGRQAAELILEKIINPTAPCRSVTLNAEIKMRDSIGVECKE